MTFATDTHAFIHHLTKQNRKLGRLISFIQADNFDLGINDPQLLLEAAAIPAIKDPYDRMIVAQARVLGLPLITGDDEIQDSGLVRTVWD